MVSSDYPLGGGHVPRPHIDPISLYLLGHTHITGEFSPSTWKKKIWKEEVNITEKLRELETKLYANKYID